MDILSQLVVLLFGLCYGFVQFCRFVALLIVGLSGVLDVVAVGLPVGLATVAQSGLPGDLFLQHQNALL